jgi:hypothetical protein
MKTGFIKDRIRIVDVEGLYANCFLAHPAGSTVEIVR